MEQHIPLGMVFAVNVLPSKQLPIPKEVPTEGPCPVWSSNTDEMTIKKENDMLKQKVIDLQKELVKETDAATKCLNDEQQQEHLFHWEPTTRVDGTYEKRTGQMSKETDAAFVPEYMYTIGLVFYS